MWREQWKEFLNKKEVYISHEDLISIGGQTSEQKEARSRIYAACKSLLSRVTSIDNPARFDNSIEGEEQPTQITRPPLPLSIIITFTRPTISRDGKSVPRLDSIEAKEGGGALKTLDRFFGSTSGLLFEDNTFACWKEQREGQEGKVGERGLWKGYNSPEIMKGCLSRIRSNPRGTPIVHRSLIQTN